MRYTVYECDDPLIQSSMVKPGNIIDICNPEGEIIHTLRVCRAYLGACNQCWFSKRNCSNVECSAHWFADMEQCLEQL